MLTVEPNFVLDTNTIFPSTLEILTYESHNLILLSSLNNLKKLSIRGDYFENLLANLIYLKFLSCVDTDKISIINKINNLKTLIFCKNDYPIFTEMLNPSIKHLFLGFGFDNFYNRDLSLKKIIPKNIVHLK